MVEAGDVGTKVALSSPLQVRYKFLHLIIGTVPITKTFSRVLTLYGRSLWRYRGRKSRAKFFDNLWLHLERSQRRRRRMFLLEAVCGCFCLNKGQRR